MTEGKEYGSVRIRSLHQEQTLSGSFVLGYPFHFVFVCLCKQWGKSDVTLILTVVLYIPFKSTEGHVGFGIFVSMCFLFYCFAITTFIFFKLSANTCGRQCFFPWGNAGTKLHISWVFKTTSGFWATYKTNFPL